MTNYATKVKEIETLRPYTAAVFVEIPQDKLHGLWKVSASQNPEQKWHLPQEEKDLFSLQKRRLRGILSLLLNIYWAGVKWVQPASFQC